MSSLIARQEIAKLTAEDAATGDQFGVSVALQANTLIVGADLADTEAGEDSGAAYVFKEIDGVWQQITKIISHDGNEDASFGNSVALSSQSILVGSYQQNGFSIDEGAAYVFREVAETWEYALKLAADDAAESDAFGWSVSLDGETAFVAARLRDGSTENRGAVCVYQIQSTIRDCDYDGILNECELSTDEITDFVIAILSASNDAFDICRFDKDESGALDGRDVEEFIARLLNP